MRQYATNLPSSLNCIFGVLPIVFTTLVCSLPESVTAQITDPVVLNNANSGADSLRQAITDAADGSTITFDSSLSGQTIRLTTGKLTISKNLTIDGSSLSDPVTISGDSDTSGTPTPGDTQIFNITAGNSVALYSLVITGGLASSDAGGGIKVVDADLVIQNTTISGNHVASGSAAYPGGGIFQQNGTVTIVNSTISNNAAGNVESTNSGSATAGHGGGIYMAGGDLVIQNSTITGNSAGFGNNSVGSCTGGDGGGIYFFNGTLTIDSSTIVDNSAGDATAVGAATGGNGGGIFVRNAVIPLTIGNSIIAQNWAGFGADGSGAGDDIRRGNTDVGKTGKNLIGNNDTVDSEFPAPMTPGEPNMNGDLVGTPGFPLFPQLQPLADNGGQTLTFMPYFDSIVVNAGVAADRPQDFTDINWNLNLTELLPVDQTGAPRVSGEEIDLGAVEYQFPPAATDPSLDPLRIHTLSKIKKLKKKLKRAKKKGNTAKAKKLKKKIKKLTKRLAAL